MRRVMSPNGREVFVDPDVKVGLLNVLFDLQQTDDLYKFFYKEDNNYKWERRKGLVKIHDGYQSAGKNCFMIATTRTQSSYRWENLPCVSHIERIEHTNKRRGGVVYDASTDNSEYVGEKFPCLT